MTFEIDRWLNPKPLVADIAASAAAMRSCRYRPDMVED